MKPAAILIAGPTASGKTKLAVTLARHLGGEVINADSMQVYDHLKIATARPTEAEMMGIPHHLFGHVAPDNAYSVAQWLDDGRRVIAEIHARGGIAVFCGGTGLYFNALLNGLAPIPPIPASVRSQVRALAQGDIALAFAELRKVDPQGAAALEPGDTQRIARALEVVRATGKPLSHWQKQANADGGAVALEHCFAIVLEPERAQLRARIAHRVEVMVEAGLIAEIEAFLALGLDPVLPAMRAIGVKEISAYLEGSLPLETALQQMTTATHQYAKRQSTWFRNQFSDHWLRVENQDEAIKAMIR